MGTSRGSGDAVIAIIFCSTLIGIRTNDTRSGSDNGNGNSRPRAARTAEQRTGTAARRQTRGCKGPAVLTLHRAPLAQAGHTAPGTQRGAPSAGPPRALSSPLSRCLPGIEPPRDDYLQPSAVPARTPCGAVFNPLLVCALREGDGTAVPGNEIRAGPPRRG